MNPEQQRLSEFIDACRKAEDLNSPGMEPLAEAARSDPHLSQRLRKSLRIDSLIGRSIRDGEVPEGLEGRILATLDGRQQPVAEPAGLASAETIPLSSTGRKRWIAGVAAAASLAVCASVAWLLFANAPPVLRTQADVVAEATHWLHHVNPQWSRTSFPYAEFPFPRQPKLPQPYSWQWGSTTHASLTVACYNLTPAQPRSLLFVCPEISETELPSKPSIQPVPAADRWLLGTWQSSGVLYVLAVEGSSAQYRSLIGSSSNVALRLTSPEFRKAG